MTILIVAAGLLGGLASWIAVSELWPARPSLHAALARLDSCAPDVRVMAGSPAARPLASRISAAASWMPVPASDLRLLGQHRDEWLARKVLLGIVGLALCPAALALAALGGRSLPWTIPVAGSLATGAALFLAPDLVTRANAAERRKDFRYVLTSYLDLVALERGGGAAPTEALEAAAQIGGGWAFERIAAALDQARKAGRPPWEALGTLAAEIGIPELADVAEIAAMAGNEGARILDTLSARAESMRAEALAAAKAQAGARSTTMVLPIAMLAAGFLVLLVFPEFYRLFG